MGAAITKQRVAEIFEDAVEASGEKRISGFSRGLELARALWKNDAAALVDDVDLTHWRMNLAIALQDAERWIDMRGVMEELVAQLPPGRAAWYETCDFEQLHSDTDVFCWYAIALQHCGDLAGALREIDKALAREPDHADSHHERACILHMMGDKKGALAAIRAAIESDGADRARSIRQDADFATLIGDPEFDALTKNKKR